VIPSSLTFNNETAVPRKFSAQPIMVLKFLEKSCAYVFDKNDFNFDYEVPPAFDSGRPSNVCNEDDFDYAIELQEHDEYREVAAKNSDIVAFTEENILKASEAAAATAEAAAATTNKPKKKRRSSINRRESTHRRESTQSVTCKNNRESTGCTKKKSRRESMESIATFASDTIKKAGSHASLAASERDCFENISTTSEHGSVSVTNNNEKEDEKEGEGEGQPDCEEGESSSEEGSDEDSDEEEDEVEDPTDRTSIFRLLKEKNFNKSMFLQSKRKRWVENHARR
jgi:hypothetical protein